MATNMAYFSAEEQNKKEEANLYERELKMILSFAHQIALAMVKLNFSRLNPSRHQFQLI